MPPSARTVRLFTFSPLCFQHKIYAMPFTVFCTNFDLLFAVFVCNKFVLMPRAKTAVVRAEMIFCCCSLSFLVHAHSSSEWTHSIWRTTRGNVRKLSIQNSEICFVRLAAFSLLFPTRSRTEFLMHTRIYLPDKALIKRNA